MKKSGDCCADFYNRGFDKLYNIKTLIKMTNNTCKELEFRGEYYGMNYNNANRLSSERNDYINMLEMIYTNISDFMNIYLSLEQNCCYDNIPTIAADR